LRITITGPTKSGKTTVAMVIAKALQREGLKVRVLDDECDFTEECFEPDARRLNAIWKARQDAEQPIEISTRPSFAERSS
jgi:uridine kinase